VRARALATIRGDQPPPSADPEGPSDLRAAPAHPAGDRLLYGSTWTMAGALDRLAAPDELLVSRAWYALEAVVRTGVRPGVVFDAGARVSVQREACAEIRRAVEGARRAWRGGAWLYFGQPMG
jgi:hypothetical protein